MSASNYLETGVLNHLLRTTALPQPTTVWASLHSADPLDGASATEITGGSYARVSIARADASWTAPADASGAQRVTNNVAITFPAPTADWNSGNPVTHVGLWDASSAGNLLFSMPLATARTILSGDPAPAFSVGSLGVTAA